MFCAMFFSASTLGDLADTVRATVDTVIGESLSNMMNETGNMK